MPTCALITLGCKVNQHDTQALREALARQGFEEVEATAPADLYVVNTCCVTHESHRKSLRICRHIARERPDAAIAVVGCGVELDAEAFRAIPGVVLAAGNDGKPRLAELVARAMGHRLDAPVLPPVVGFCSSLSESSSSSSSSSSSNRMPVDPRIEDEKRPVRRLPSDSGRAPQAPASAAAWPSISEFAGHTRAFVKIEDGCNDFCAYCIVPYVRGRVRSRPPDEVVAEVQRLVENGYLEVVLTGIHLGCYGQDTGGEWALVPLIERLLGTPGLRRLRLSSLELREVSDELLDLMAASDVLCPHLHIPLQSGDDHVLRAMNRHYTAADFLARVEAIRARIPEPAVTTDVLVGFPGETDAQFRHTLDLARAAAFTRIHVFPYSDREGTAASRMDGKLPPEAIKARRAELLAVARRLAAAYHRRFLGRDIEVLVEGRRDRRTGLLCGYSPRYVRAYFEGTDELCGSMVAVRTTKATPDGVLAERRTCMARRDSASFKPPWGDRG